MLIRYRLYIPIMDLQCIFAGKGMKRKSYFISLPALITFKAMKRIFSVLLACSMLAAPILRGQTPNNVKYSFTEASDLTLIGKLFEDTPNPYHRVDTVRFKGFTKGENAQVRCSAGLAVLFKTNSSTISVKTEYGYWNDGTNTMPVALNGYDLYIKKDGKWTYARAAALKKADRDKNLVIIKDMNREEKECMLYLPMYSEEYSVKIGVEEDATIAPLESEFRHRIAIFGSSFTQGISISRSGMSYPMQFMRNTGLQILSLGCSGNCKMQPYFADVLAAADVDAMIFDSFSNPSAEMIKERLFPFIERIQAAHPDIPLIFQQTIYRESRNFSVVSESNERKKQEMAEKLMAEATAKYKNVYFVRTNATDEASHDTSVDSTHPSDWGYMLWEKSIEKPVLKILKKYGIK